VAQRLQLKRTLAVLLLPASLLPVLLLSPSLARAPLTYARHWEAGVRRLLAPAHPHRRPRPGPPYFLVGAARFEVDVFEVGAGALTPQVGVSPLAEPGWAVAEADRPLVLIARGAEVDPAYALEAGR
jgi:hypothetical protein